MNDIGGFLYYRNQIARAQWAYRWAQQGGSFFHPARSLQDLRDAEGTLRGQRVWRAARALRKIAKQMHMKVYGNAKGRKVINLAAWRFDRERQKATRQRVGAL
jgi:hypothetical protein